MCEERNLTLLTGAASGIGPDLARLAARHKHTLLLADGDEAVFQLADEINQSGGCAEGVIADMSASLGVDLLVDKLNSMPSTVHTLIANTGQDHARGFLDHDRTTLRRIINDHVTSTIELIHRVGNILRREGRGEILITTSPQGMVPGSHEALHNGSKAFLSSFALALRKELATSGVSVTCRMPGARKAGVYEQASQLSNVLDRALIEDPKGLAREAFNAMLRRRRSRRSAAPMLATLSGDVRAEHPDQS